MVKKSLRRQGLRACVKTKKPLLTKKHRARCLQWVKKCKHADWKFLAHVSFSDESKFNIFGLDGCQHLLEKEGRTSFRSAYAIYNQNGGGNIMVWSCMSWEVFGKLHLIEGMMDKYIYCNILKMELMGTIQMQGLEEDEVIFQHDNDPKHTAHYIVDWLRVQKFQPIGHLSQSPDLNPIEHLWNEVDCCLRRSKKKPTNKSDLWEKIQEIWYNIEPNVVRKLIYSMPKRAHDVYQARGGYTWW